MKNKGSSQKIIEVSTNEISEIFGVSKRRIQQLTKEDALVKIDRGKYDLGASIRAYIDFSTSKPEEELNKSEEEAKWTRARRQKAELELSIMRGELHRSEDVKRVMNNMLSAFRSRIISIPAKLAGELQGKTDYNEIKEILKTATNEALHELADYDPQVFYAESKDKISIEDPDAEEEMEDAEEGLEDIEQTKKKR